nr:hypothetical protein [Thiomonas sp.]
MSHGAKDPTSRLVDVDWNDPKLQELLKKTESLRLDNRGMFKARRVLLRRSWHPSGAASEVLLVADPGGGKLTVLADFPLDRGDPVTLDKELAGNAEAGILLCEVVGCRRGSRPEDAGREVFVIDLLGSSRRR